VILTHANDRTADLVQTAMDGVYVDAGAKEELVFLEQLAPSQEEVEGLCHTIARRVTRLCEELEGRGRVYPGSMDLSPAPDALCLPRQVLVLLAVSAALLGAACKGDGQGGDWGSDASGDAGYGDAARPEASASDLKRADRASADAFKPISGFGTLSGECGVLDDTEWSSSSPTLFRNTIAFSTSFDSTQLSTGGLTVWTDGNRGGSSLHSEVFSYEILYRCELAKLLKTEKGIIYQDSSGKKTDLLVEIDSRKIGVSVTRAYHYPPSTTYTETEAKTLLEKKLADLPLSQSNATAADAWSRSILHVFAYDSQYATAVENAWSKVSSSTKGDAIVILTITDGTDDFIYSD
jgi:hypothetical protein